MKDDAILVFIFEVSDKALDSFEGSFEKETNVIVIIIVCRMTLVFVFVDLNSACCRALRLFLLFHSERLERIC